MGWTRKGERRHAMNAHQLLRQGRALAKGSRDGNGGKLAAGEPGDEVHGRRLRQRKLLGRQHAAVAGPRHGGGGAAAGRGGGDAPCRRDGRVEAPPLVRGDLLPIGHVGHLAAAAYGGLAGRGLERGGGEEGGREGLTGPLSSKGWRSAPPTSRAGASGGAWGRDASRWLRDRGRGLASWPAPSLASMARTGWLCGRVCGEAGLSVRRKGTGLIGQPSLLPTSIGTMAGASLGEAGKGAVSCDASS